MGTGQTYDYIIIGSGPAGAVLANRLSATDATVLVLEAGRCDDNPQIHAPNGFTQVWGTAEDWQLATTAQAGLANREVMINQGKVMGGSSSINAMMYVRGNRRNFDRWNALGADGWCFDELLPYFKRSENYAGGASAYRGSGGELNIQDCPDEHARAEPFLVGATELGYAGPDWDYNGERQEDGAGLLQFHIQQDGKRASAATAFLHPVMDRENLTVTLEATATRILTQQRRAIGVEYLQQGEVHQVHANREVILSAGALASPKLLMLSGIGPAAPLQQLGIPLVADLPGVGQNLQDHVQLPVIFRTKEDHGMATLLTGNVLFTNTRERACQAAPDLQLNFTPAIPSPLAPVLPDFGGPVCIFLPILVQPFSSGELTLRSSNPLDPPRINPNYLQQQADYQVFVEALTLIRSLTQTSAFSAFGGEELAPGPGDPEAYIRNQSSTLWHPVGTARMGQDRMAVVDPQLRVHGIDNLRVADAAVMPTVTSGNTVATCFMIGEKAADMILNEAP